MPKKVSLAKEEEKQTRIAIVDDGKCKPKKCNLECKKTCPVVKLGKLCIEVKNTDKIAYISEELCIGCGICTRKCPFEAISIINLPKNLETQTIHRYGPNSFKQHRLPTPRIGKVVGQVGTNGIGKSTALKILSGKTKPNLGRYTNPPDWNEIILYYRGSELQNFFTNILENKQRVLIKPQFVDSIAKMLPASSTVREILESRASKETNILQRIIREQDLQPILDNTIETLSGGELQRFSIAIASCQDVEVYMFDEPSSYLDVKQRIQTASMIRSQCNDKRYVIAVEHDLSVLDFLSDFVVCLYGTAGAYGVVSMPFSVREGINVFLEGYIRTENLRFRDVELTFKISERSKEQIIKQNYIQKYTSMTKTFTNFSLTIEPGEFSESEIIVLLGQNGTGKTTFMRILAGLDKPDNDINLSRQNVSYKPQKISPKFEGTVRQQLLAKIASSMNNSQFIADVMKPMKIDQLMDQKVKQLSGGEQQRVAQVLTLGIPADIYLIDEPSAYLDSEQRVVAARVIKRFILHSKKTAFIVEHDFIMSTYLASRVIVYDGEPGKNAIAHTPQSQISGMNRFLRSLSITFRRDPYNYRPRINKLNSQKDAEQKASGNYFFIDTEADRESLDKADKAVQKSMQKVTQTSKRK